jgi:hypothetical protein
MSSSLNPQEALFVLDLTPRPLATASRLFRLEH